MNDSKNKVIFRDEEAKETLVLDFGVFAHDDILDLKENLFNLDLKNPISVEDISSLVKDVFKDSNSKVDQFNEFSLNIKADIQKNEETKIVENDPISIQADIITTIKEFAEGLVVKKAADLKVESKKEESKEDDSSKKSPVIKNSKPAFLDSDKIVTKSDGLNPEYKEKLLEDEKVEVVEGEDKEKKEKDLDLDEEEKDKGEKNGNS